MATSTLSASRQRKDSLKKPVKRSFCNASERSWSDLGQTINFHGAAYPEDRQHPGALSPGAKGSKGSTGGKRHGRRGTQNRYRANAPDRARDKDVQLKLLRNFDASEQRKTRSDKAASEILGTFGGVTIESFPGGKREPQKIPPFRIVEFLGVVRGMTTRQRLPHLSEALWRDAETRGIPLLQFGSAIVRRGRVAYAGNADFSATVSALSARWSQRALKKRFFSYV